MKRISWKVIRMLLLVLAVFLIYLVVGALAPFVRYKDMPDVDAAGSAAAEALGENGSGERVILLETAGQALEYRLRLLGRAKEEIILSTFDMRTGESTDDIAAVLLQKAEEGVRIRILVDGYSGQSHMEGKEVFYALSSHPNIEIRLYNPVNLLLPWKSQGRMHDKYVIVDEIAYILGGRNTCDYFIGDYPSEGKNLDREVLVYAGVNGAQRDGMQTAAAQKEGTQVKGGKAAGGSLFQVREYFEGIWELECCRSFHDEEELAERQKVRAQIQYLQERYRKLRAEQGEYFQPYDYVGSSFAADGVWLLYNPTGIYGKEPLVFAQLAGLMQEAQERVVFHSPYAVLNEDMVEELREVAGKVPQAELMINSVGNGDNVFASSDYIYRKQKVLDTGLTLYEYEGGTSYHGKSVLIDDDISIIGSYNLDLRSTYMDTELMLVIRSRELNRQLYSYMQGYQAEAKRVLSVDSYEMPEGLELQRLPRAKEIIYRVLGLVMTPFRCLI